MPQPTVSDLIFSPQANHNFSKILGDLKRSNLSITNRLKSIKQDAAFVERVARFYGLPLVANERCGSWYIDPDLKKASAYFKSTDGHTGQWSFSTRRLNLHLLEVIGRCDGCIVVDSTRRGKKMPDALSKTIPIWCCVMNRVLFPDKEDCHDLHIPPKAVSESEKSQIEARLPDFVESFKRLSIDVPPLRQQLSKPLRPVWSTQDDPFPEDEDGELQSFPDFYPVFCCTGSRHVVGTEMSEAGYIQGAGDDTENWAHGLTAQIFWAHADELLSTPEGDLPSLIESLVASSGPKEANQANIRQLTPVLFVSPLPVDEQPRQTCLVKLTSDTTEKETWIKSKTEMEVGIGKSKAGGRNLRHALPTICDFVKGYLDSNTTSDEAPEPRVIIACQTGKDLSIGLALALDCWCFTEEGKPRLNDEAASASFTKTSIRVRLGRIMTAMPEANPSRTTLQSVNSFLMDYVDYHR